MLSHLVSPYAIVDVLRLRRILYPGATYIASCGGKENGFDEQLAVAQTLSSFRIVVIRNEREKVWPRMSLLILSPLYHSEDLFVISRYLRCQK
jgi:hypothetical protein